MSLGKKEKSQYDAWSPLVGVDLSNRPATSCISGFPLSEHLHLPLKLHMGVL
jgi:hypothetical protein